jgi:hypothetical protein
MSEPVAWIKEEEIKYMLASRDAGATDWKTNLGLVPEDGDVPLYLEQQKKEWVGLTQEEIWHMSQFNCGTRGEFARAIDAKLKEKNS